MKRITTLVAGLAASTAGIAAASPSGPPIVSTFDSGLEGWSIADLDCGNYNQVVGGGTIDWIRSGGAPGAFLRSTDPAPNCYSYQAPAAFTGDRSAYLGGSLRWRIRTNVADWLPGSVLILIGGGLVLVADIPHPAVGQWLSYSVALDAASFHLNTASGPAVTDAQLQSAMASLASIRISAEFGSEQGEETVDLDSVALVTSCPADLNGDGTVDGSDLAILLGAWGTGAVAADLDADLVVGASDLAILLGAWGPCA